MITYDNFKKLDLRVATVVAAERVQGSEKLIKLQVDIGSAPPSHKATEDSNLTAAPEAQTNPADHCRHWQKLPARSTCW